MSVRQVVALVAVGAAGLAAGALLAPRVAFSEDVSKPAGAPSEEEMKKMMAERAALSEEHKKLAALAGTWDAEIDCSGCAATGGEAPKPSKGTFKTESALGGRVFLSRFQGEMGGMPFEGIELRGYDKEKKQHWTIWCDSMGTGFLRFLGERAADGSVAMKSDAYDCMGTSAVANTVTKVADADHMSFEMTSTSAGAPDQKMTIKYTRRK